MTNGVVNTAAPVNLTVPYNSASPTYVDCYFIADSIGSAIDISTPPGSIYPLNILLLGTKGGNEFGQNLPFLPIYLK